VYDLVTILLLCAAREQPFVLCPPEQIFAAQAMVETDAIFFTSQLADSERLAAAFPGMTLHLLQDETPTIAPFNAGKKPLPAHAGFVLYTSGSTGKPVGVLLSGHSFLLNRQDMESVPGAAGWQKLAVCTSVFSSYGLALGILFPLLSGKTIAMAALDHPQRMFKHLHALQPDCLLANPAVFISLQEYAQEIIALKNAGLKAIVSSGALLPEKCFDIFHHQCGIQVTDCYGTTETNAIGYKYNDFKAPFQKFPSVQLRTRQLDDTDEALSALEVGGPKNMQGYLFQSVQKQPLTWIQTGDLVARDTGQEFVITGRMASLIKIHGKRVQAELVENFLEQLESIAEVLVYAQQTANGEEILCAAIVPGINSTPDVAAITAALAASLPAHMIPRRFIITSAIEKSNGKKRRTPTRF
jgi:nonribosomal peptide synthetase DhbF